MKKKILFLVIIVGGILESVCGTVYLKTEKGNILISPNGKKLGEINNIAPMEILEEKADFVKIQVTGWIRKKYINFGKESVLKLISFQKVRIGTDKKLNHAGSRVRISMRFKNNGKKIITDWEGILTVKNVLGQVLTRFKLKSVASNIAPGKTQELNAEISSDNFTNIEVYNYLEACDEKNLKLELSEVIIQTEHKGKRRK